MLAYEFYCRDKNERVHFIGILPERRKKPKRITEESVINWGRTLLGDNGKGKDIFFERVTINNIRERILWVNPSAKVPLKNKSIFTINGNMNKGFPD